jgi:ribosomal protein L11 methyltransferase
VAIDNDQLAVDNAKENLERNSCHRTTVEKGDADSLKGRSFDAILANIERNTLLKAMQAMYDALNAGGILFLSGFVVTDRHMLVDGAKAVGMTIEERLNDGDWALLGCRKP